ncbi:MAG: 3-dehydroquinate synthase [Atopobiaceae bacterium]|jgi:3-dehydroquinate synthase|nr:3-dehydroquinate synthase [Atopobiaceae bacterium]
MRDIRVSTPSRAYDVHVGTDLLAGVGSMVREAAGGHVVSVITDDNVAPLYADEVCASLERAGYDTYCGVIAAGERSKNYHTWSTVCEGLAQAHMTRDDVVVALGGGVVGDLAGFAAASYMRGCQVAQVPTSLLAMVDSSVGGKTAIDLEAGKNLVGAFLQPSVVVADVGCLRTLSRELLTDSCGEVIKHAVLADADLLDDIASVPVNGLPVDPERLERVVARNVEIKRDVVDADETERGRRQTLNLGHTIGHAIESASGYSLGHGTCVAAGLCMVTRATAALGLTPARVAERVCETVASYGLPTTSDLPADVLFEAACSDKKRHGDAINVVVVRDIGEVEVRPFSLDEFRSLLDLACGRA